MEEPSVLDYVKARLRFRRGEALPFSIEAPAPVDEAVPTEFSEEENGASVSVFTAPRPKRPRAAWPWRAVIALGLALVAQFNLEPTHRSLVPALVFYFLSAVLLIWAIFVHEWEPAPLREDAVVPPATRLRVNMLFFIVPWVLASFLLFGGDEFNLINVAVWVTSLIYLVLALWVPASEAVGPNWRERTVNFLRHPSITVKLSSWGLLLVAIAILAIFFRFYQLNQIPGEPFSDHAEKLLDVNDVLNGKYSIFFPRNTGREAIQFYLTAAIINLLGTGVSFISLKIGTALAGLLTLPYVYLFAKEFSNKKVAILALLLTAVAYWPNTIARIGLRFPLYPLFAAPALYYFFRGLRTSNRNDYVMSGLALGLGLHGYSPSRIMPIVLVILFGLYLVHPQARGKRLQSIYAFIILAVVSFVVFLPLFRYVLDNPELFSYRAMTRLAGTERAIPGAVWLIFLQNLWNATVMFFWSNGDIWVHSVVNRPALDLVSAALFFLGSVMLIVRYLRTRRWQDLLILVSIPLLMLPSILSLAFPGENPSLNRTGGAYIPVFTVAAIALEGFISSLWTRLRGLPGKTFTVACVGILLAWSITQNYDLVFHQFKTQFMGGALNTYEIGHVVRSFADSIGTPDTAYVVPFPYWVDTRLVGINAGYPTKDYALSPDDFGKTLSETRAKLFILKSEDQPDIDKLKALYPGGRLTYYKEAQYEGKDFWEFLVPAKNDEQPR